MNCWALEAATASMAYLCRIKSMKCLHDGNNELDVRSLQDDGAERAIDTIENDEAWGR